MRKVLDSKTVGNYRLTIFETEDGKKEYQKEALIPATLVSVNEKTKLTNSNNTGFFVATVKLEDGDTGSALIWEAQYNTTELPEDTWAPGAPIRVAMQLNGEYAGNCTVQLPGGKFGADTIKKYNKAFDMDAFADMAKEQGIDIGINA